MSNRFHNKIHSATHYTIPVSGIPDSATDPIASPEAPFIGPFSADSAVVLGDATISVPSGDIMHVNRIINSPATSASVGITRFATISEAEAKISNEIIISPRDLAPYSGIATHTLISPTHKLTDTTDTPIHGDCFIYDGSKWTASRPAGIYAPMSTNQQASGGSDSETAINVEQLHREIRRNKSIYIKNATEASINAVFASMSASPNTILSGTLAFTDFNQYVTVGTGNGGTNVTLNGVSIWEWTGTTWIKRY